MSSNYPDDFPIDSLEAREAFQGDVSRREVEITISVDAEMANNHVRVHGTADLYRRVFDEAKRALRKSWEDEQEEKKR